MKLVKSTLEKEDWKKLWIKNTHNDFLTTSTYLKDAFRTVFLTLDVWLGFYVPKFENNLVFLFITSKLYLKYNQNIVNFNLIILVRKPGRIELFNETPGCCVFWPAFECCVHPKAGQNTFFSPFQPLFVHFSPFSVISHLKSTNNVWKWTKNMFFFIFCLLLKAGRHAKAGGLPEGVPGNHLFSVDFLLFSTIFTMSFNEMFCK